MEIEEVNILVVDDVNSVRIQVHDLLKNFGFKSVTVVGNGEEAIKQLAENPFHLVLADWQMSPISGIELLKYIRNHEALKTMAFIMISAESTKEKVIEAIQSGVDDYLIKPITFNQIQSKVYGTLIKRKVL